MNDVDYNPQTYDQSVTFILRLMSDLTPIKVSVEINDQKMITSIVLTQLNNYPLHVYETDKGTAIKSKSQCNRSVPPYVYGWKNVTIEQRALATQRVKGWVVRKLDIAAKKALDIGVVDYDQVKHLIIRPIAII